MLTAEEARKLVYEARVKKLVAMNIIPEVEMSARAGEFEKKFKSIPLYDYSGIQIKTEDIVSTLESLGYKVFISSLFEMTISWSN